MKKVLFWATLPLTIPVTLLVMGMQSVFAQLEEVLHWYEGWCFDYKKHNVYKGGGIWVGKTDQHYDYD